MTEGLRKPSAGSGRGGHEDFDRRVVSTLAEIYRFLLEAPEKAPETGADDDGQVEYDRGVS